jgi:hypothetical protein
MGWTSISTPKHESENRQNCWINHRGSGPGRGIDQYHHRPRTTKRRQFGCIQCHNQLAGIFGRRTGRHRRPDIAESVPNSRSPRRDWIAKRWRRRLARGEQSQMTLEYADLHATNIHPVQIQTLQPANVRSPNSSAFDCGDLLLIVLPGKALSPGVGLCPGTDRSRLCQWSANQCLSMGQSGRWRAGFAMRKVKFRWPKILLSKD